MALDFNQISARLTRLPDDALSAFARQHMSNYSIMSLVANERSRRKGIRDAAALKMAGTPPPVNEQLVASLSSGQAPTQRGAGDTDPSTLPENQGLGLLPIKTAYGAEGGIVGYADRGLVDESDAAYTDLGIPLQGAGVPTLPSGLPIGTLIGLEDSEPWRRKTSAPAARAESRAAETKAERQPAPAPAPAPARAASRPASGIAQLAAPRAPAVDPRQQAMEDARYFFDQVKPRDTETGAKQLEAIEAKSTAAREKARKEYLAALPKDQIGAEAEARYKKEAEAEPERRKEAFYMAMIEAGLGMMASSSPYALQGIGEGAMKGVGSYKNAMKELDSLARSRNEALDSISKARRAEQMGNAKEAYEYAQTADSNANKFAKEMFNFIQGRKDLDQQDKMNIMKSIYADFNADARLATELRSREKIAGMQLAARTDQMDTLNAQYAAAVRAGDTKRAEETLSIIRNLRGAPRGALTDAQENAIVAKFFERRPIAETVYSADPTYRQAVLAAAARGETPPMPTQEQIRASRAPRVQPGSITPVGQ